ncbi:Serine/threonine-protein kinase ark1 [Brettanomyces nanus]|uniref:Aurora kinase n=1 Tax=Eeniella nana TaxID=13502 RepID=A0A875S141_EENNA|nr:Serine/threonine-protein kinase ark1 [Brettanomyces nanus]QPG74678.1 Serine/threonine-protein kinase ark1 [Brettanomyces nanus]
MPKFQSTLGKSAHSWNPMGNPVGNATGTTNVTNNEPSSGTAESVFKRLSTRHKSRTTLSFRKKWTPEDFEMGKKLGKGKFGRVYCVREKQSGYICALKVMSKEEIVSYKVEKQFVREIEIQANLRHSNCLRLYGWFYDDKNVYLILEYAAKGELYQQLKKCQRFDEARTSYYIYQVASALSYLHKKHIIHRDLKPENILMHFHNQVKLSDFGWSVYAPQDRRRTTMCGTLDYLPPEMVEAKSHNEKVDVWALGVLMYELLVGKPPFEDEHSSITYKRIAKVDLQIPHFVSTDATDLIKKLLRYDPAKRLSLQDLPNHPWITRNRSQWQKLRE